MIPSKASLHLMEKLRTKTSLLKFTRVKIVSKSCFFFQSSPWGRLGRQCFPKNVIYYCKNYIKMNVSFFLFLRTHFSCFHASQFSLKKSYQNRCFFVFDACRANADPVKLSISDEFALGRLLGASWVPPGCSWVPLGCLLGAPGCFLGGPWVLLGCLLGAPGSSLGASRVIPA